MKITDDMEEIMESGERIPVGMIEPGLIAEVMDNPVFDGRVVVDQSED